MKLEKIIKIDGIITLKTGLHIGAGNDEIKIGGIDNPVVKHPVTNEPYIPGSSLKGKIRTLLEWCSEKVTNDGKPWSTDGDGDEITKLFGNGKNVEGYTGGPTRLSFSDCFLTEESAKVLRDKGALTESKYEVSIDRISGTAMRGGLRQTERVPAGAEFGFSVSLRVFNEDNKDNLLDVLLKGMKLLSLDSLGGHGSRGYGKVEFRFNDPDIQKKFEGVKITE